MDDFEPSRPEFDPSFAADMENFRVQNGRVETRKGSAFDKSIPGSGDVRLTADHTESDGTRIRLAARGNTTAGVLYDFVEGTDTVFNAVSGGTSLGGAVEPYFQGVTLGDRFFLTARAEALRVYEESPATGDQLRAVAQPVAPGAAPGVKARPYAFLDSWNGNGGVAPFGWTESNNADYAVTDVSSTFPAPGGGRTVRFEIKATTATNDTIQEDVQNESVPSHTIAYWVRLSKSRLRQAFEFGLVSDREFSNPNWVSGAPKGQWYPRFIEIGGIGSTFLLPPPYDGFLIDRGIHVALELKSMKTWGAFPLKSLPEHQRAALLRVIEEEGRAFLLINMRRSREGKPNNYAVAAFNEFGTRAKVIRPKRAKALRWQSGGKVHFATVVRQPASPARPWFYPTVKRWPQAIQQAWRSSR